MYRTIFSLLLFSGVMNLLYGCSVAYDLQQDVALDACNKIVDWSQRTECMNRNKTSFEEYEKQRQDVINKNRGK